MEKSESRADDADGAEAMVERVRSEAIESTSESDSVEYEYSVSEGGTMGSGTTVEEERDWVPEGVNSLSMEERVLRVPVDSAMVERVAVEFWAEVTEDVPDATDASEFALLLRLLRLAAVFCLSLACFRAFFRASSISIRRSSTEFLLRRGSNASGTGLTGAGVTSPNCGASVGGVVGVGGVGWMGGVGCDEGRMRVGGVGGWVEWEA